MEQNYHCPAPRYGGHGRYAEMTYPSMPRPRADFPGVRPEMPRPDCCRMPGTCPVPPCGKDHILSKQPFVPAMAYVPDHDFDNLFPAEKGFCEGTIFACLCLPFTGKEVR